MSRDYIDELVDYARVRCGHRSSSVAETALQHLSDMRKMEKPCIDTWLPDWEWHSDIDRRLIAAVVVIKTEVDICL